MTVLRLTRAISSGPGRSQPRILHTPSCPDKPDGTVRYELPAGMTVDGLTAELPLIQACPRCLGLDGGGETFEDDGPQHSADIRCSAPWCCPAF